MAGIGDKAPPRRRRAGLMQQATEKRRKDLVDAEERQPAVKMEERAGNDKVGWYIAAEVNDLVRDAVEALQKKGLRLPGGRVVKAGSLMEPFIRDAVEQLARDYNDGAPFPESKRSKAAKKRRKRK